MKIDTFDVCLMYLTVLEGWSVWDPMSSNLLDNTAVPAGCGISRPIGGHIDQLVNRSIGWLIFLKSLALGCPLQRVYPKKYHVRLRDDPVPDDRDGDEDREMERHDGRKG